MVLHAGLEPFSTTQDPNSSPPKAVLVLDPSPTLSMPAWGPKTHTPHLPGMQKCAVVPSPSLLCSGGLQRESPDCLGTNKRKAFRCLVLILVIHEHGMEDLSIPVLYSSIA